jgi:hypothetical protein
VIIEKNDILPLFRADDVNDGKNISGKYGMKEKALENKR